MMIFCWNKNENIVQPLKKTCFFFEKIFLKNNFHFKKKFFLFSFPPPADLERQKERKKSPIFLLLSCLQIYSKTTTCYEDWTSLREEKKRKKGGKNGNKGDTSEFLRKLILRN